MGHAPPVGQAAKLTGTVSAKTVAAAVAVNKIFLIVIFPPLIKKYLFKCKKCKITFNLLNELCTFKKLSSLPIGAIFFDYLILLPCL